MTARIPYLDLAADQKQEIHLWLADHHVDHTAVPVYAEFDYDAATSEWRIPVYWRDADGRMRIDLDSHGVDLVRQHVVRRRERRPLPWPSLATGRRDCGCAWEVHARYVEYVQRCAEHQVMCRSLEQWEIELRPTHVRLAAESTEVS